MADLENTVFVLLDRAAEPVGADAPIEEILRAGRERRRQRRLVQGGSVLAVVAAVTAIVLVALNIGGSTAGTVPIGPAPPPAPTASGPTALQIAHGRWTNIPAAPFSYLCQPTTAWDGREILVVNADIRCLDTVVKPADVGKTAAYDPRHNAWRPLARAPLDARGPLLSTWTGSRLVVVAPESGQAAAYDPGSDSWQRLAEAPKTSPTFEPSLVATGTRAFLIGVGEHGTAVFELADNTWSRGPSIPARPSTQLSGVTAGTVGDSVLAVATYQSDLQHGVSFHASLLRLDSAVWTSLPEVAGLPANPTAIVPFENRVLAIGTNCPPSLGALGCPPISVTADVIDPGQSASEQLPQSPLALADQDLVAAGRAVLSYTSSGQQSGSGNYLINPGATYVLDYSSGRWLRGPRSVPVDNVAAEAWTPYGLIVLGSPLEKTTQQLGGLILRPATH